MLSQSHSIYRLSTPFFFSILRHLVSFLVLLLYLFSQPLSYFSQPLSYFFSDSCMLLLSSFNFSPFLCSSFSSSSSFSRAPFLSLGISIPMYADLHLFRPLHSSSSSFDFSLSLLLFLFLSLCLCISLSFSIYFFPSSLLLIFLHRLRPSPSFRLHPSVSCSSWPLSLYPSVPGHCCTSLKSLILHGIFCCQGEHATTTSPAIYIPHSPTTITHDVRTYSSPSPSFYHSYSASSSPSCHFSPYLAPLLGHFLLLFLLLLFLILVLLCITILPIFSFTQDFSSP